MSKVILCKRDDTCKVANAQRHLLHCHVDKNGGYGNTYVYATCQCGSERHCFVHAK